MSETEINVSDIFSASGLSFTEIPLVKQTLENLNPRGMFLKGVINLYSFQEPATDLRKK